jgi:hypothetical protein
MITEMVADATRKFAKAWHARVSSDSEKNLYAPFYVVFLREGVPVSLAGVPSSTLLTEVVSLGAYGYSSDTIAVLMDTCAGVTPNNPLTGMEWEPGEADEVRIHHAGEEKGWVRSMLIVSMFDTSGAAAWFVEPYHGINGRIEWAPDDNRGQVESGPFGFLVEDLAGLPAEPPIVRDPGNRLMSSPDDPLYPPEKARIVLDVGTTRVLDTKLYRNGRGYASFIPGSHEEGRILSSNGLESWQILQSSLS